MRVFFEVCTLLLCCLTTSLSAAAIKREAPLPPRPTQTYLPASAGFSGNSLGNGNSDDGNFEGFEGLFGESAGSDSFKSSSGSSNLGDEGFNLEGFGNEGGFGDFSKLGSNTLPPSTSYGKPILPSKPASSQKHRNPSQSYGTPSKPSQGYGTPSRSSSRYGVSTTTPPTQSYGVPTQRPTQNYGLPSGDFGSNDGFGGKSSSLGDGLFGGGDFSGSYSLRTTFGGNDGGHSASSQGSVASSGGQKYDSNGGYVY